MGKAPKGKASKGALPKGLLIVIGTGGLPKPPRSGRKPKAPTPKAPKTGGK